MSCSELVKRPSYPYEDELKLTSSPCASPSSKVTTNCGRDMDIVPSSFGSSMCCLNIVAQYVCLAVVGSFTFGYSLSALNTSMVFIGIDFKWCSDSAHPSASKKGCAAYEHYAAFLGVGVFLGAAVGCLIGGKVTEAGRRVSMLLMHGILILGSVLSAGAEGFASLLIARIVVGVGVGFSTVCVPMLLSEITPKQSRGFYGVFHQLLITIGIFASVLLGLAFGNADQYGEDEFVELRAFQKVWWRFLLGFPVVICLPSLLLFLSVYTTETPHHLVQTSKYRTAEAFLKALHNTNDVSDEFAEIKQTVRETQMISRESISVAKAVVNPAYTRVVLVALALSAMQQLTGINVLVSASNKLYSASGLSSIATYLSIGMCVLNVIMTVPSIFIIDRVGRRSLLLAGCAGQASSLLLGMIVNLIDYKATFAQYISVTCTFTYVLFFSVAYGPVLWVYLHEIFPNEIKQSASATASAVNWISTVVVVLPSSYLLTDNVTYVFIIFTVTGVITWFFVFFFVRETKGLSINASPYLEKSGKSVVFDSFHNNAQKKDINADLMELGAGKG